MFYGNGVTITFPCSFSDTNYAFIGSCGQDITIRNSYAIGIVEQIQDRTINSFTAHGWNVNGVYDILASYVVFGY